MVVGCIQKGGSFMVYRDKGAPRLQNGYVVAFSGNSISYITSKGSQTVIVIDDNFHRIKSFCAPRPITEGIGWKK